VQDVLQAGPLAQTLGKQIADDPLSVPSILAWAGPGAMLDWLLHYLGLALFAFLHWDAAKYKRATNNFERLPRRTRFMLRRALEQWEYGAGADFKP
jgi:hypothetical protein